jgi:hypothetical protein
MNLKARLKVFDLTYEDIGTVGFDSNHRFVAHTSKGIFTLDGFKPTDFIEVGFVDIGLKAKTLINASQFAVFRALTPDEVAQHGLGNSKRKGFIVGMCMHPARRHTHHVLNLDLNEIAELMKKTNLPFEIEHKWGPPHLVNRERIIEVQKPQTNKHLSHRKGTRLTVTPLEPGERPTLH